VSGIRALRKIQLGKELTAGTEANATAIWRGQGTMEDQTEVIFPEEDVGYLSGVDRSYIAKVLAAITFDETPATFEQLPYLLAAGIENITTGSADGAGTGKIYQYDFPTTSANSIQTYTIEAGDNEQEEQCLYGFVERIHLAGAAGEAVMMEADWLGRQVATGSYTASLSLPTVEEILFGKGKLYIDPAGSIGSTQKSNTFLEFALDIQTGWVPVFTGDGNLYWTFNKNVGPEVTLDVTFEHETTSIAEKAAWRAETARAIRMLWEGSELATAGTTYTYKTLNIDLMGKWESFEKIDERDGNDIVTGTLRGRYNSTEDLFGQIIVVNALSALT